MTDHDLSQMIHLVGSSDMFRSDIFHRYSLVVSMPVEFDMTGVGDGELACRIYQCRGLPKEGCVHEWFVNLRTIISSLRFHQSHNFLFDYLVMSKADAALLVLMVTTER